MNKQAIITILFSLVSMTGQAQITLKGSIINERGEKIEYVSIGLEEDSIGTISDADGNFTIEIRQTATWHPTWRNYRAEGKEEILHQRDGSR